MESKLENIGEMLHNQILNALKDKQPGAATRKGKNLSKSPTSHAMGGFSSSNGGRANWERHESGVLMKKIQGFGLESTLGVFFITKCLIMIS